MIVILFVSYMNFYLGKGAENKEHTGEIDNSVVESNSKRKKRTYSFSQFSAFE